MSSPQHNFLVTLCHQNKNLVKNSDDYILQKSLRSPKISAKNKSLKRASSYQLKDRPLTPPDEIYEEYSLAVSNSILSNNQKPKRNRLRNLIKQKQGKNTKDKRTDRVQLSIGKSSIWDRNDRSERVDTFRKQKQIEVNTDNLIADM